MAKENQTTKSRSSEDIFTAMHRELRAWNPQIPESPERLDPVLRLLLQLYSKQLAEIDGRIDMVWDVATNSLIRSLCPERMRWPVPAFTVIRCDPVDPVVEVDPHVKFFYKETREGGQTLFFSTLKTEKLISASVKHIILRVDDTLVDLSPLTGEELQSSTSRPRTALNAGRNYRVYIGVDHSGTPADFTNAAVFLKGIPDVLKQLQWANWFPASHLGNFHEDSGFCPGLTGSLESLLAGGHQAAEWGGLRTATDLFKPLENSFVILPEKFTTTWELGPPDEQLTPLMSAAGIQLKPESEKLYWIRVDLPPGGDKAKLQSPFEIYFNCFVSVNKNELTLFKHTGGNRLVEVELPESITSLLEITSVVDSGGREYLPRHQVGAKSSSRYYTPEERDDKLVLWFDFSSVLEMPPDSLTINYSITAGVDANGIEAGKINDLYENHPGISSAVNIIPTGGAIPAKTEEQIISEVKSRLRNRDRSLSFQDIARWTMTFDPRIRSAAGESGVERTARGVRRCIVVKAVVDGAGFFSEDEVKLLQIRLGSFLKSRSPVNTHYRVEISKG
jgi:hypothetical protein